MEKYKRKREEEEKGLLEEAYEEFRETFEDGIVKTSKTFIRGDVVNPDKTDSNIQKSTVYKPAPVIQIKNNLEVAKKLAQETAKKIMSNVDINPQKDKQQQILPEQDITLNRPSKPGTANKIEKSRLTNLEAFKEELKQMQAMRDERKGLRQHLKEKLGVPEEELNRIAPTLDAPYFGSGMPVNVDYEHDPTTTNLYVCNLPPDCKLEDIFETFGSFGPLASAKILFPKPEEERYRATLSGFVAFMSRLDAERSMYSMHGDVYRGCELRVSWARPVTMPPLPFYVPPPLRELAMPDPPSGLPFNAKPQTEELRLFLKKYHDLPKLNVTLDTNDVEMCKDYKKVFSNLLNVGFYAIMIENSTVRVVVPTERPLLQLIHRVVEFLVRSGPLFEAILMAKERQNPMYR
uniref:RRM domain-containing protein n=2 Tax=Meloidogyne incognita group TaxID=654580 RepID=A0A914LKA9_MELIC